MAGKTDNLLGGGGGGANGYCYGQKFVTTDYVSLLEQSIEPT